MSDPDPAVAGVRLLPAVDQVQDAAVVVGDTVAAAHRTTDLLAVGVAAKGDVNLGLALTVFNSV